MALKAGFFDSVNGDRKYDAGDFGGVFESFMTDGVNRGVGNEFGVTLSTGRGFLVGVGRAFYRRKWLYNDAPIPMTLEPADAAQPRLDTLVLDIDTSTAARAASLRIIKGVAAANPTIATLINTATRIQVPLYALRLEPNDNTRITVVNKLIGSSASPYSQMRLQNPQIDPAIMHRNTVRGQYLGNEYTYAQKQAVLSGSFDELFLGDFWVINGTTWRIVDMDYYFSQNGVMPHGAYNNGIEYNSDLPHHLVVMPDAALRIGQMNVDPNKQNAGGYNVADMRYTDLPPMFDIVTRAFGLANMMSWSDLFSTAITDGRISGAEWRTQLQMELPSQIQMWGHDLWTPRSRGEVAGPILDTISTTQFSLFRMASSFIRATNTNSDGRTQWLRDVVSTVEWAVVSSSGASARAICNAYFGYRPYFCLA